MSTAIPGGSGKAAVLGSPVDHSLSPVLHGAGYEAAGLKGWTYERIECDADQLPGIVGGAGEEYLSLIHISEPTRRS